MALTRAILGRVALAVSLIVAAASAQAVPIVFDFTGTVSATYPSVDGQPNPGDSLLGQAVVGRIVVELDGLAEFTDAAPFGTTMTFSDVVTDPAEQVTSELSIGGIAYDVGAYSGDRGGISAYDSNGVPICPGCSVDPDRIVVSDASTQYWRNGASVPPPGQYFSRNLVLAWSYSSNPLNLVDLSNGFEPLDLMPLLSGLLPTAYYTETTMNCADFTCTSTASSETRFLINSLTLSTPSVPEPGALALFAVGLLGGAVARRSAAKGR